MFGRTLFLNGARVLALIALASAAVHAQTVVWVAGADLVANELGANPTSNPNSLATAWSYGRRSAFADTSLFLFNASEHGINFNVAGLNGFSSGDNGSSVIVNTTNTTKFTNFGPGTNNGIAPSELWLHPASNNDFAVVRWTAPASGTYTITSAYWRDDDPHGGNGTDVHIVLNGIAIFDASFGNGGATALGASLTFTLAANDKIDFLLGSAGDWTYDSTACNATISALAIPEPGTAVLLAVGVGLFAIAAWRRRAFRSRRRRASHRTP